MSSSKRLFSLIACVVILGVGCSKGSDKDPAVIGGPDSSSNTEPAADSQNNASDNNDNSAVFGTWVSRCEIDDSIDYYEWTFGPDQVVVDAFEYALDDIECSFPTQRLQITYAVTYLSGVQQTVLGAATRYDLTPVASSDSASNNSEVSPIPVDVSDVYGIFLVLNNRLYGGNLESGEGTSAESRPTRIDETAYLTKK